MEIKALSATGIQDFLQCNLKFVFRYDREVQSMKNDNMKLGIAVHEALEQFTRRMSIKKSFPDASDYEFTTDYFMNSATKIGLENMEFYSDGKTMVTRFIDDFNPAEEVIGIEHFFEITTPEGVPIRGGIDKVIKIDDDTIGIIDYKTSRSAKTDWQLRDDIQLSMYDYAASLIWPEFKNRVLMLDYVRIDKRVSTFRTDEKRELFGQFLESIWLQVNKLEEREVSGSLNSLCGWCDYKTYCGAYEKLTQGPISPLPLLSDMSDTEFLDHWEHVAERRSILEARQRELKMIASEKAVGGGIILDRRRRLYSTQAVRTTYNIEDVIKIIPQDDLFSVLAVNKAKVDRYAKDKPEVRSALSEVAGVNYNAPTDKVKSRPSEDIDDSEINENKSAA